MTRFGISIIAGSALLFGLSATAQAGGFYEPAGSMKDPAYAAVAVPAPMPIPETTAWYIRGDVGYARMEDVDIQQGGLYDLTNSNIDDTVSVGGGIGYYFNSYLRGDVTVEYFTDTKVYGINPDVNAPVGGGSRQFDLHSTVALANLYYDFDQRGQFSPYIGVGVGIASNQAAAGDAVGTTYLGGTSGIIHTGSDINFAWALMAGVSYQVSQGLHIDANYRYLNIGGVNTGFIQDTTANDPTITLPPAVRAANSGGGLDVDDIQIHQIRIGVRQDIW